MTSLALLAFFAGRKAFFAGRKAFFAGRKGCFAGRRLGRNKTRRQSLLFAEILLFTLIFAWFFAGRLSWANALPRSGVVYWSNVMPVLLGFLAGMSTRNLSLGRSRYPASLAFCCIAVIYLALPVIRPAISPAVVDQASVWRDGVCLQGHESTCAPAAATTLLRMNSIAVTERDMIRFCLTSQHGTEPLGLYRGLKLATQNSGRDLQIATNDPHQWVSQNQLPNVALIKFSRASESESVHHLLGRRGEGHAVVVIDFEDGHWIIGDPAVGEVRWTDEDFRKRFTGDAIYLAQSR